MCFKLLKGREPVVRDEQRHNDPDNSRVYLTGRSDCMTGQCLGRTCKCMRLGRVKETQMMITLIVWVQWLCTVHLHSHSAVRLLNVLRVTTRAVWRHWIHSMCIYSGLTCVRAQGSVWTCFMHMFIFIISGVCFVWYFYCLSLCFISFYIKLVATTHRHATPVTWRGVVSRTHLAPPGVGVGCNANNRSLRQRGAPSGLFLLCRSSLCGATAGRVSCCFALFPIFFQN